jgi:hypothetical protein
VIKCYFIISLSITNTDSTFNGQSESVSKAHVSVRIQNFQGVSPTSVIADYFPL